eukprot:scaffold1211_cov195-Alexandrium_tamarense.AAC.14
MPRRNKVVRGCSWYWNVRGNCPTLRGLTIFNENSSHELNNPTFVLAVADTSFSKPRQQFRQSPKKAESGTNTMHTIVDMSIQST